MPLTGDFLFTHYSVTPHLLIYLLLNCASIVPQFLLHAPHLLPTCSLLAPHFLLSTFLVLYFLPTPWLSIARLLHPCSLFLAPCSIYIYLLLLKYLHYSSLAHHRLCLLCFMLFIFHCSGTSSTNTSCSRSDHASCMNQSSLYDV